MTPFKEIPSVRYDEATNRIIFPPSRPGAKECKPYLWIDGKLVRYSTSGPSIWQRPEDELKLLDKDELAMLEVYPRMSQTPMQFVVREYANMGPDCGVIVVTTKRYLH